MNAPEVRAFVRRGILPENLPPAFTTTNLWEVYSRANSSYLVNKNCKSLASPYNASKRGGSRRNFSIQHPTHVYDIALFIQDNWDKIREIILKSSGSLSKPVFTSDGYRAVRITPHAELPSARLKALSKYKFCVVTDVSRCYPSIYTHSIPWVIDGREVAKSDIKWNSRIVTGNRLDYIIRQSQDGQTVGIPIGPDTSRVVAEIVLSGVDLSFLSKYKRQPTYIRHVDDYWIGGHTIEECEKHIQNLRVSLREFELDINDLKTKIIPVHRALGESWPSDIDKLIQESFFRYNGLTRSYEAIACLSNIVDRAIADNDDGMIRHAIRKIDEQHLWKNNWDILEHFLAQCAIQFPHSFDYVARVISWRVRTGEPIDHDLWREAVLKSVAHAAPLGRDSETLWALWLMNELKIKCPKSLSNIIVSSSSPIVLSYIVHLHAHGKTNDKKIISEVNNVIAGNPYSGPHWPLALELKHLELEGSLFNGFSGTDNSMRLMHDSGTSIVQFDARPPVFFNEDGDEIDLPENALEDYTSEYDHDESENDYGSWQSAEGNFHNSDEAIEF